MTPSGSSFCQCNRQAFQGNDCSLVTNCTAATASPTVCDSVLEASCHWDGGQCAQGDRCPRLNQTECDASQTCFGWVAAGCLYFTDNGGCAGLRTQALCEQSYQSGSRELPCRWLATGCAVPCVYHSKNATCDIAPQCAWQSNTSSCIDGTGTGTGTATGTGVDIVLTSPMHRSGFEWDSSLGIVTAVLLVAAFGFIACACALYICPCGRRDRKGFSPVLT